MPRPIHKGTQRVAKYNDGPAPEEFWHPSDDNLRTPRAARPRLGAAGPYVINLSASNTPFSMEATALSNWFHLHIYQVQRVEDGRLRFRLRLGPITSELEADVIVAAVRESYPFALTATAGEDDLRAIAAAALGGHRTTKPVVESHRDLPRGRPERAQQSQAPHADRESVNRIITPPSAETAVRPSTILPSRPDAHPGNQKSSAATWLVTATRSVMTTPPSPRRAAPVTGAVKPVKVEESQPTRAVPPTRRDGTAGSTTKSVGRDPPIRLDLLLAVDSTQTFRALTPIELGEDQLIKMVRHPARGCRHRLPPARRAELGHLQRIQFVLHDKSRSGASSARFTPRVLHGAVGR